MEPWSIIVVRQISLPMKGKCVVEEMMCAPTKQSSMLRTCGASGAVRALEARKVPISKAGEVKIADSAE
jgi:hypothetical protein